MNNKMLAVAAREYRGTIRTKSFLIAIVLMPIFMGGSMAVQKWTKNRIDTDVKRVAVLDPSGRLFPVLEEAAKKRNETETRDESGQLILPPYALEAVKPWSDPDGQRLELSERVRGGGLFAFVEVPAEVFAIGKSAEAVRYYSNQGTYGYIQDWLEDVVSEEVQSIRLAEAGVDKAMVRKALAPVKVDNFNLFTQGADGKITQGREVNREATFFVAFSLVMLMWMAIMMTTQPLLQGVIEEKMQKISEVLLGSVRPFDLMLGKLIGFVGVAITLVGIYMIGGYALARNYGYADMVPVHLVGWFLVFQALAILMYGSLFLAAGACCSDIREAQNLVMPLFLVLMIPMFTLVPVLKHPSSSFATWMSLFPPATPILMIVRMATPPGAPLWQPIAGMIGTLGMTAACVWIAGRIFRLGLLMQGKPPRLSDLAKWALRG